ncbi:hypothetical protein [Tropicimonas sp. IMCC6043]|uniref:hypothetical protein n=1 Tax=Tropicimonas sp. IMCC6043 TaxID=2510645 RepID=UPI00101E10C0|nr:hypothetical protein [Tropicimonas sp. IMCC6043]RYH09190.1 hypothetical protein EU800_13355 [Tropicimonas sp. IMCC6043]
MSDSPAAAIAFVETLDLPDIGLGPLRGTEAAALPPPDFTKTGSDSVAVGSQIAAFAEGFDEGLREPIANAFLLAQLAADKQIEKTGGDTEAWYREYVRVLGGLGLTDEDRAITLKEVTGTTLEVHKEIIPVLTAVMAPAVGAATALKAVLDGLAAMDKNSPWITLFDRTSQRAEANQFQISYADVVDGVPVISLAAFVLEAHRAVTQVLFFRFSDSGARLRHFSKRMTVNPTAFGAAGPAVARKLAERTQDFVADIEI